MALTLELANKNDFKIIKPLYISAFPKEERAPFFMLKSRAKSGQCEMYVARDESKNNEFVGFAYLLSNETLAYLFFFAIAEDKRKMGYGSAILDRLQQIYKGKKLFLARETLDEDAENYTERIKRHEFYLKNNFSDLTSNITEFGVIYDVMGLGGEIYEEEYMELMSKWVGAKQKHLKNFKLTKK